MKHSRFPANLSILIIFGTLLWSNLCMAQTCVQFTDNYGSSSSLNNYSYYDGDWNPSSAVALNYGVGINEFDENPVSTTDYSYLTVNSAEFPTTLSNYTVEGDFKLDTAGQGVFGLIFLSTPSSDYGYIFQWNGLNNRWEIEKQYAPGTYYYVATNTTPSYSLGTWVHLKVTVSGGVMNAFETPETGPGTGLGTTIQIFTNVTDPGTTPPYTSGAAGIRSYNVVAGNTLHIANFTAYTCQMTTTPTSTPTSSPTATPVSLSPSATPTLTPTPTATSVPCGYPGNTCTPTATPSSADIFYVSQNLFTPSSPVSILVEYNQYSGPYDLCIYNTAGEHIRTLASQQLSAPVDQWYVWDGKNKRGDPCASGVYIIYLTEPFSVKVKRVVLLKNK